MIMRIYEYQIIQDVEFCLRDELRQSMWSKIHTGIYTLQIEAFNFRTFSSERLSSTLLLLIPIYILFHVQFSNMLRFYQKMRFNNEIYSRNSN